MAHDPTRPTLAGVTEKPRLFPPSAVPWPGIKGKTCVPGRYWHWGGHVSRDDSCPSIAGKTGLGSQVLWRKVW